MTMVTRPAGTGGDSQPETNKHTNPLDAFGISTAGSSSSSARPQRVQAASPATQPRVQTASPISPPPGFGGLWGDLDTKPSLPDSRTRPTTSVTDSEARQLSRRGSTSKIGNKVMKYVRKAASRGTTPETSPVTSSGHSPPRSPVSSASHSSPARQGPRSKAQCLMNFVLPRLTPPTTITNLYGPDAIAAFETLGRRTLQVQYHSGLEPLLLRQLQMLRIIPRTPRDNAAGGLNRAEAIEAEEYACSLHSWMSAEDSMSELAGRALMNDIEVVDKWRYCLAQAINTFIEEPNTFREDMPLPSLCSWQLPRRSDAEHRFHDWLASNNADNKPRAMLSWRMDSTAADFEALYAAAVHPVPANWVLEVGPGFDIRVDGRHVRRPHGVSWGATLLALLAWQGMHHYRVRWSIIFNGDTAIVTYLAKNVTLFVSRPFCRTSDSGLTIASAMFALAAMNHRSDSNRPSVTMRNDSLGFYKRPLIQERMAELRSRHEWAASDFALYREGEVRAFKTEPDIKEEYE